MGQKYVEQSMLKISSRNEQHETDIFNGKWQVSGITQPAELCDEGFNWKNILTLKVEDNKFDRKVREALEIQF